MKLLRRIPAPIWISWALCLCLGCVLIVMNPIFSPIDEEAHYRVIEFIANEHALPNMVIDPWFYESVQPPLYYVLMALPFRLFSWDLHLQILALRGLGVCMLLGVLGACFAMEPVLRRILPNFPVKCYRALFLFFCFSPGVLTRFSTISNEPLAVLFSILCFYWILRMFADGVTGRSWLFCTIFLVAAVMTKITTLFWFAPLFCLLLWQKKLKFFFASIGIVFAALVPWFISNYRVYGALTGMGEHAKFIGGVDGVQTKDVWLHTYRMFITLFLSPEAQVSSSPRTGVYAASILATFFGILFLLYGAYLAVRFLIGLFQKNEVLSTKKIILIIACAAFVGNLSTIYYGSFSSGINLINGRYLMHSIPALSAAGGLALGRLPRWGRIGIIVCLFIFEIIYLIISLRYFLAFWLALQ